MKITSKGQVTIPRELREQYGFLPHTEVEFKPTEDGLKIVRSGERPLKGERLVRHMAGRGDGKMSTDEIMRLTRGD